MAVATWVYETSYQASAAQALAALQQRVLRAGDYERPWLGDPTGYADELLAAWDAMGLVGELLAEMESLGRADTFDRLRAGEEPRDRVEAVLWSGAGGTRSVLDIEEAEPLGRAEVTRLFGVVHPDIVLVRDREAVLHAEAAPDAQYLVAYDGGFPAALFFFGASGH